MKTIRYKGAQISYAVKGVGPSVVMLHGFLEDHSIWDSFVDLNAKSYSFILPDILGHGDSGNIGEVHTMEDQALLIDEILKLENIKQAVLVGHSMGGYVALSYAQSFPEKMKGLCLFHSTAFADDEQKKQDRLRSVEIVKKDEKRYVNDLVVNLFAKSNVSRMKSELEKLQAIGRKMNVQGICAALLGMRDRVDRQDVLEKASFPVQFIMGKEDNVLNFMKNFPLIGLPQKSFTLALENVGHLGFLEAPELVYPTLANFLNICFL